MDGWNRKERVHGPQGREEALGSEEGLPPAQCWVVWEGGRPWALWASPQLAQETDVKPSTTSSLKSCAYLVCCRKLSAVSFLPKKFSLGEEGRGGEPGASQAVMGAGELTASLSQPGQWLLVRAPGYSAPQGPEGCLALRDRTGWQGSNWVRQRP